jgi:hypothetical protein
MTERAKLTDVCDVTVCSESKKMAYFFSVSSLKEYNNHLKTEVNEKFDHLCGLVARVPGYRSRGPGFDSRRYQIFRIVGLERGPLSLVSTIE